MTGSYKMSLLQKHLFIWTTPVWLLMVYIVAFSNESIDFKVVAGVFFLMSINSVFMLWKRLRTNVYEIRYSVPKKRLEFIGFFGGQVLREADVTDVMYDIEDAHLVFITSKGDEIKLKAKDWRDTRDIYSTFNWWPHHLVSFYMVLIQILSETANVHTKFLSIKVPDWKAMKTARDPRVVKLYQELDEVLKGKPGNSGTIEKASSD